MINDLAIVTVLLILTAYIKIEVEFIIFCKFSYVVNKLFDSVFLVTELKKICRKWDNLGNSIKTQ